MKRLTCEMCGGTDLVKQDGVFICQTCGTKYSVEEAKKMMIEGTVEVVGTVKIDDSNKIENFMMMAQNAYVARNLTESENYCNRIIEIDPNNYKAWLLKGKAAGWQSTLGNLRIEESVVAFNKALDNTPEDVIEEVKDEVGEEIIRLCVALMRVCCDNFAKYPSEDNEKDIKDFVLLAQLHAVVLAARCGKDLEGFKSKVATMINAACVFAWNNIILEDFTKDSHPSEYVWKRFTKSCRSVINLTEMAIKLSNKDSFDDIPRYENLILYTEHLIRSKSYTYYNGGYVLDCTLSKRAKELNIDKIMKYHQKIKEINPSYEIPERPSISEKGCYIATAIYGSYDCPQVWTLRRYRDNTLASTWYGRAFIHTYYAISPTLVRWFGDTKWFKKMWRVKLDRIVSNLLAKGVEDTPYEDKNW